MTVHTHPLHCPPEGTVAPEGYHAYTIRWRPWNGFGADPQSGLAEVVILVRETEEARLTEALEARDEASWGEGYLVGVGEAEGLYV